MVDTRPCPPKQTAVAIVSQAVAKLESAPVPADTPHLVRMVQHLGEDAPLASRVMLANRRLFDPLIVAVADSANHSNAAIRTTTAATVIRGGTKDNVLPQNAAAVVNFRVLPGETITSVTKRVTRIIDDSRIQLTAMPFPIESVAHVADQ